MTESPARRHAVVQTRQTVSDRITEAIATIGYAEVDLVTKNGMEFTVRFRVRATDHDEDGSHLIVGVTDLDQVINVQITADGQVFANLSS